MYISKVEFAMCMEIMGYDIPAEFDVDDAVERFCELNPKDTSILEHLAEQNIFEKHDGRFRMSALGQRLFSILNDYQVKIIVHNRELQKNRAIYVLGADYLCVDIENDGFRLLLLPILPFAIGAYAKMLESLPDKETTENRDPWSDEDVRVTCGIYFNNDSIKLFSQKSGYTKIVHADEVRFQYFTETECVNYITSLLLEKLHDGGE